MFCPLTGIEACSSIQLVVTCKCVSRRIWNTLAVLTVLWYIGPAPKLSRTPGISTDTTGILNTGQHTIEVLKELQYPQEVCDDL